ncbi:hypothetical protein QBC38DRAFT_32487 [Podospora fimiseda]|uniref:Uncharacterized protein n=1 Tax=Podospora fimiseda TaxID=252190 RepID=A0AAN7BWH9_9PEZI|nr:hypothetical protein QBC38DRAFT_32487 [Podospora fimiseda]
MGGLLGLFICVCVCFLYRIWHQCLGVWGCLCLSLSLFLCVFISLCLYFSVSLFLCVFISLCLYFSCVLFLVYCQFDPASALFVPFSLLSIFVFVGTSERGPKKDMYVVMMV